MKKIFASLAVFAGLALSGFTLPGCDSIDAAFDCNAICTRYSECFDADYDVDACESRCRSHSSDDTEYRERADACDACIDDRACTSATFSCGAQCISVVP